MAPKISAVVKASKRANKRQRRKPNTDDDEDARQKPSSSSAPPQKSSSSKAVEFAAAPRLALHDIAMEPPTLQKKLTKSSGGKVAKSTGEDKVSASRMPVSLAQREALESERLKVIELYRALKERKLAERKTAASNT
jgi:hypothetical protein